MSGLWKVSVTEEDGGRWVGEGGTAAWLAVDD